MNWASKTTSMEKGETIVCKNKIPDIDVEKTKFSRSAWENGAVFEVIKTTVLGKARTETVVYAADITVGKEYRVTGHGSDWVCIANDSGGERYYLSALFESKAEIRRKKLEEIGI